jgi:DNA-binding NtrC family response regulator
MPAEKILVVDDEQSMAQFLAIVLRKEGYQVSTVQNGRDALEKVKTDNLDVVITDIRMPGMDGIQLLQGIKKQDPGLPVVIMTAYASQQSAIDAVNLGAFQYLIKNAKNDEIKLVVRNAIEMRKVRVENQYLKRELRRGHDEKSIIGSSEEMLRVFKMVDKVADSEATIMIQGESGTGKELIAKAIHLNSPRRDRPFVPVNTGSMPPDLLESTLFGHVKGAFTSAVASKKGLFEIADRGTLFLDEIGTMGMDTQSKILRVLQDRKFMHLGGVHELQVDVRIIAATNVDLKQQVRDGKFREDLFYRLNVITIDLPPLRQRKEDIPLLVEFFLNKYSAENERPLRRITPEALRPLLTYAWPGNVRELENVVERAVVLSSGNEIGCELLPAEVSGRATAFPVLEPRSNDASLFDIMEDCERHVIVDMLEKCNWNQTDAAERFHVPLSTLNQKIKRLNIEIKKKTRE